ncbi:MAG: aminotransferase class V-fold PLP-dependent enzyme [Acidobacteria bacterium]|nr:aminotransferase class V-fold PLP-dependent enzyme [Acidobacteriota bacterium]MDA1233933.1 aminotransferase class V-fold PLP-dependent enzyme [Acidobacteriota bacterium]
MTLPIYLDHQATTPVDVRVLEAMLPYFCEVFGNAASRNHSFGWRAREAVSRARDQLAELIGASSCEIVFTSGATESNNLAIRGAVEASGRASGRVITCATEHKAVLDPCLRLRRLGFDVVVLPVDSDGLLDPQRVADALTDDTVLVSVMYANNEIGVLQPIAQIGAIVRETRALFHVDAAQAVGKIGVDVERDAIDLLSLSAHKFYGPKGAGALYVSRRGRRAEIAAQMDGGGHERGLRSGTLNVPGIVGLGAACDICREEMEVEGQRLARLRDRLKDKLFAALDGLQVNGSLDRRLPNNLSVSFAGVDGESLLMGLDELAVSSGSACTSESPEPSHVLRALGVPEKLAHASLRFGLGRQNTEEEVDYAADKVAAVVTRLRRLSA